MPAGRTGFIDGLSSGVDGPVNNLLVFCPMGDHAPAELCGFEYLSSVYTRESVGLSRLSGGMAKAEAQNITQNITPNNLETHIAVNFHIIWHISFHVIWHITSW
jgi:hypothetical protein